MRKFDLVQGVGLEQVAETPAVVEEPLKVLEPVVVADPLKDESDDTVADETEEAVGEVIEAQATLESLVASLEASLVRGGMTASELHITKMHADYVTKRVGLESITVSNESTTTRVAQTQLALESINEKLKETGKAIVEFIRKLFETIRNKAIQFKEWLSSGFDRVTTKLSGLPKDAYDKKIKTDVRLFKMGGKLSTDLLGDLMVTVSALQKMPTKHIQKIATLAIEASKKSSGVDLEATEREIRSCIESHYKEVDVVLKFDHSTGVATRAISGRYPLTVTYDNDTYFAANVLKVGTSESESDVKTITLRSFGLTEDGVKRWESIKGDLETTLANYQKLEDSTWKEFDFLTNQSQWQDNKDLQALLKGCALVSAQLLKISTILNACIVQTTHGLLQLASLATETSQ